MVFELRRHKRFTAKEYLMLEEVAAEKSEFYNGEIYAMAGASVNHNRIARNATRVLGEQLKGSACEEFPSDLRTFIIANNLYTYADATVVCGELDFESRTDTITNPTVIIKALSSSTADYDRGQKFHFYQSIPTLLHYLLIDQYRIHVEHRFLANDSKWQSEEFIDLDDSVGLTSLNVSLGVRRLYERVAWE